MSLEKIQELRSAILELDGHVSSFLAENPTAEKAGEVLAELNFLKRDMSVIYEQFANLFAEIMGLSDTISLPDGTTEKAGSI
jgi:uncharacterized membrane protein YcaP (DUF421 family)